MIRGILNLKKGSLVIKYQSREELIFCLQCLEVINHRINYSSCTITGREIQCAGKRFQSTGLHCPGISTAIVKWVREWFYIHVALHPNPGSKAMQKGILPIWSGQMHTLGWWQSCQAGLWTSAAICYCIEYCWTYSRRLFQTEVQCKPCYKYYSPWRLNTTLYLCIGPLVYFQWHSDNGPVPFLTNLDSIAKGCYLSKRVYFISLITLNILAFLAHSSAEV